MRVLALNKRLLRQEGLEFVDVVLHRSPVGRFAYGVHVPICASGPSAVEDAHEQGGAVQAGVTREVEAAKLVARAAVVEATLGACNVVELLAAEGVDAEAKERHRGIHLFQVHLDVTI